MSLRNLEIFSQVCQYMNMSRAAEYLHISQSSVSQAIAELEREYQVRLFERLSKKLYLTKEGKTLLFYAVQILQLTEQMDEHMKEEKSAEHIRIGACTTVGAYFMNPLVDQYQQACPQTMISVEVGNSSMLERKLLSSQLDLAFVQDIGEGKALAKECSLEDRLIFVCRCDHPLAGKTLAVSQLEGQHFVVREEGSGSRRLLDDLLLKNGVTAEYTWVCNNISSMKDAVLHGRGLCLLSEHLVQEELQKGELAQIHIKGKPLKRHFHLICHKNKFKTPGMEYFVKISRELAGQMV